MAEAFSVSNRLSIVPPRAQSATESPFRACEREILAEETVAKVLYYSSYCESHAGFDRRELRK